uniref:Slc23a-2 n=1 Tax=Schmidtea mediterranea TaxID=79327 RepID=A0A0H3YJ48_SCHMD|nr:slc23a-2 [Schmidtea mediterranea]
MDETCKEDNVAENDMDYDFNTPPPWYLSIALGVQHFLTMCAGNAITTIIVSNYLCLQDHSFIKSELISSSFLVMGISSFLQTILGCKLPIIQGASFVCVLPSISLLTSPEIKSCNGSENIQMQKMSISSTAPEAVALFKIRLLNGAIMISSLIEIFMAVSGLLQLLTKLISPLSLAAIFTVLSLNLSENLLQMIAEQWAIGIMGMVLSVVLIVMLSQVTLPIPFSKSNGQWQFKRFKIFQMCPIVMALGILWILCGILTMSGVFSTNPKGWGYSARTDTKFQAIYDAKIVKFPYPCQWGTPLLLPSAIIGVVTAIILSIIESVGDYMITADVCKAPNMPQFAINRGIFIEGIGVFLSGFLGSITLPTSYSGNIGVMKITKAGNIRITQVSSAIMILCGIFPIFGAIFISIPNPVVGGVLFIVCLFLMGCGINNFQYIDFLSTRNIIIYGFSVSFGLYFPAWCTSNIKLISVGYKPLDEIIHILLTIHLFIVAVSSIFLDNVLPGNFYGNKCIHLTENGSKSVENCNKSHSELEKSLAFDFIYLRWVALKFPCLQILPLFPAYRNLREEQVLDLEDSRL